MKETDMFGKELKEDYELKKCCKVCGFPLDIPRGPVFITNNILSLISYQEEICDSCGHQKSGWTITSVHNHIRELRKRWDEKRNLMVDQLKKRARHGDVGGETDVLVIRLKDVDEVFSVSPQQDKKETENG